MWNIRIGHVETTGRYILGALGLVLWEGLGSILLGMFGAATYYEALGRAVGRSWIPLLLVC